MKRPPRSNEKLIRRALELVRDGLRSGAIPAHNFEMRHWTTDTRCGTVACIGGWTSLLLNMAGHVDAGRFYTFEPRLAELFFTWRPWHPTRKQAAKAIDRYLDGQEPWPQVAA